MPTVPVLKGRGGREVLWVQGSGDRETGPRAHPLGGQGRGRLFSTNSCRRRPPAPKPQAFPRSPSWPGLPVSGEEASGCPPPPASQRGPPGGPAGQRPLHAGLSPADASPRLWPEPRPARSPRHRCCHSLALDELLGNITEPASLNPPLSGEKRGPSLPWPRAPGCRSMRPLCVPLAPVLGPPQGGGWAEGRGEAPGGPRLRSLCSLWLCLACRRTVSGLAEAGGGARQPDPDGPEEGRCLLNADERGGLNTGGEAVRCRALRRGQRVFESSLSWRNSGALSKLQSGLSEPHLHHL